MFTYPTTIRLHDTDAAGVLFFANQFKIVHDAFEALLELKGLSLGQCLSSKNYLIPIVHAQADYKKPLTAGDSIVVQVSVERIGATSFTLTYSLLDQQKDLAGTAKTVHVTIDKKNRHKIPLPAEIRSLLQES